MAKLVPSGRLKGFLRADGRSAATERPFTHDDPNAYLIGTRDGVVPRRRPVVCIGECKTEKQPDHIRLLRDDGDQITVETTSLKLPQNSGPTSLLCPRPPSKCSHSPSFERLIEIPKKGGTNHAGLSAAYSIARRRDEYAAHGAHGICASGRRV